MVDFTPGFNLGISDFLRNTDQMGKQVSSTGAKNAYGGMQSTPVDKDATKKAASKPASQAPAAPAAPAKTPYAPANDPYKGGGDGSGSGASAADLAYLDDQEGLLRGLLSRTGAALTQGLTQLDDDYGRERGRTEQQRADATADYAVRREDTTRDKGSALDNIDTNARMLANMVRGIIGRASGSGSSAYQLAAPDAVARDASLDRSEVQDTFGRNFRDLDTGEKRMNSSFEDLLADLFSQRQDKERGLREGVLSQEQSILGNLADVARSKAAARGGGYGDVRAATAPLQGEIASRQGAIDELFNKYRTPFTTKAVDTQAPTLSDYRVDRAAVGGATSPGSQQYSPYSQFLRKNDEDPYA